jgi:hypothetical protein
VKLNKTQHSYIFQGQRMSARIIGVIVLACLLAIFFAGCAPTVYCGAKDSSLKMSQVTGSRNKVYINGRSYLEATLLVKVDAHVVGSYQKGWPKTVRVQAGERKIEVRYYRGWEARFNNSTAIKTTQGSCLGNTDYYKHYIVTFMATKEQKYKIVFRSECLHPDSFPQVSLEGTSGQKIDCMVQLLNPNNLALQAE